MVAQVNEQNPTMIAHPMNPAREADRLTYIFLSQVCAGMAAESVHHEISYILALFSACHLCAADTHGAGREVNPKQRKARDYTARALVSF
jgi:hypothetical protein